MKKGEKGQEIVRLKAVVELEEEGKQLSSIFGKNYNRKKQLNRVGASVIALVIIVGAVFAYYQNIQYTDYSVGATYKENVDSHSEYYSFADGVLKYGKNGVTHITKKGETNWNHGYQMSNPTVTSTDKSAAIGNIGGNEIITIDEAGVKGEIETNLPILNIAVSEQGIVATILESEKGAVVVCYDAVGTVLVEHTPTLTSSGVPTDVALSKDGMMLIVTYLKIEGAEIIGRYAYYDLGKGDLDSDKTVIEKSFTDEIPVKAFYLNGDTSAVISDSRISIYKDGDEKAIEVSLDKEVELAFCDDRYIGVLLRNRESADSELRIYNPSGVMISSTIVTGEYTDVEYKDNQVILYEGSNCKIVSSEGKEIFEGNLQNNIMLIQPEFGIGEYMIINLEGIQEVQLKR